MPGFVYLFRWAHLHKIGHSGNPQARLGQVAPCGSIVHLIESENPCQVERALHLRFASLHVRSEWFELSDEDVDLICQVARADAADDLPTVLLAPTPHSPLLCVAAPLPPLGPRITSFRERAGLSQPQAAEKAGIPVGTLRGWEQGRRVPLLDAAAKLADAIGCSLDELAGRSSEAEPVSQPEPPKPERASPSKQTRRKKGGQ